MPRRVIRLKRVAPDGRTYILEQHPKQPRAQIRVWLPSLKTYRRMTIPYTLRGDLGRRDGQRIAAASAAADELVAQDARFRDAAPVAADSLGAALAYACDIETTKPRHASSAQTEEWRRAREEVLAVLPAEMVEGELTGQHVALVAQSALARRLTQSTLEEWAEALLTALPGGRRSADLKVVTSAIDRALAAQRKRNAARIQSASRPVTRNWPTKTAHLMVAMLRHAAQRGPRQFSKFGRFKVPEAMATELANAAGRWRLPLELHPHRPQRSSHEARALMRAITDPRYFMWQVTATLANGQGAMRLLASEIRIEGDIVLIFCRRRAKYAHRKAWHALGAAESAALRMLLSGAWAELERQRAAGGPDYAVVGDTRWDGERLRLVSDPELSPEHAPAELLDIRAWLLFMLGAEGRGGQMLRLTYDDLKHEGRVQQLLLHVPGRERKRETWLLLARIQQHALAFAMRVGYLADLERARRAGLISNYPLFPQGPLADGRVRMPARCDVARPVADAPRPTEEPRAARVERSEISPAPAEDPASRPSFDDTSDSDRDAASADPADEDVDSLASLLAPMDGRVLNDWARRVEQLLKLERVVGEGLYGWRRIFITLFNPWEAEARAKDLLSAHATIKAVQHGSTRTKVYLDPVDLPYMLAGQRLLEHVRTEFVRTGEAPPPRPLPTGLGMDDAAP